MNDVMWDDDPGVFALRLNQEIYGDMTIVCYEQLEDNKRRVLWKYWVHTAFLPKSNDMDSPETEAVGLLAITHL